MNLMGDHDKAQQSWREINRGGCHRPGVPACAAAAGLDSKPLGAGVRVAQANSYYQAMSLLKLGETDRAKAMFQQLIDSGTESVDQPAGNQGLRRCRAARQGRRCPLPHRPGPARPRRHAESQAGIHARPASQPDHLASKVALAGTAPEPRSFLPDCSMQKPLVAESL